MELVARKWENMSHDDQSKYLQRHKKSKHRLTNFSSDELDNVKRVFKTHGLNGMVEAKQDKAENQVDDWAKKLQELGLQEEQTDSGRKFVGNDVEINLDVKKGKMRYFAMFEIQPKQFEMVANHKEDKKEKKKELSKQLRILYTNGQADEFVKLLNENWYNPIKGGLADEKSPIDFDKEQLIKGIKVEFEHVSDIFKAAKIVMDHLTEMNKYYDKLETIEKHADCDYELKDKVYYMKCDNEEIPVDIDAPAKLKAKIGGYSMLKHFATIHKEFVRFARKWEELTHDLQVTYLHRHPGSRRHLTSTPPPRSQTSGLKIYEPVRPQSRDVLSYMRDAVNADPGARPVVRKYLTNREGSHNKYHYFAILKDKDDNFVAANVYGRIGYPPKGVAVLSRSPLQNDAEMALRKKLDKKLARGYKPTVL